MTFGEALRQAREAQGLSTQDVALRTKIRGDYLRALEEGNLAQLPERTFARSYLQRYARELQLDPAPLLADFDRTVPLSAAQELRPRPAAPAVQARRRRRGLVALLGGLLLLGAAAGYLLQRTDRTAVASTPAQPATTVPATDAEPAAPAEASTVNLSVSSVPPGARVYLDNRDLGRTPLRSFPVDARNEAELRVEFGGRETLRQTVNLTQGRNLRARLLPAGQGPSTLTDLALRPKPKPAPKPKAQAGAIPAGAKATDDPAAPAPTSAKPTSPVSLTFTAAAWTRVTDASGRVLYEGTPPVGTRKGFPTGVTVRTGNAGAVLVSVNGAAATALGQAGQVTSRQF
ncbi:RodZ domain-containing protein [Deinococcus hohokamensis]|uniref:RodZ domain-containing protein n=1 Tax=Deinococcus hohokamensis TaxID=309883 RepID=A0ABV9IC47_9DEIO